MTTGFLLKVEIEKTTKASRFNWRLQSCAAFVAFVVFVAIAVCQADTSLMLFLFVVAPILLVISILLLIYAAIGKGRSQRLPLLSMLAILWTISTSVFVYDITHPSAIRSAALPSHNGGICTGRLRASVSRPGTS